MLLLTLFLSFTGYLLPWDQLAFWAVTVGTNIASSVPVVGPVDPRAARSAAATIEQATLIRFYVLHVIVLPGAPGRAVRVSHVARPEGRRPGERGPRCACSTRRATTPVPPTKTYTLLGVARGTAPTVRATTLEAPDTTVNAVPDLTRRAAIVTLGTIAVVSILSVVHPRRRSRSRPTRS